MAIRVHQERVVVLTVAVNAVDCPNCGVVFGITEEFEKRRRADGQTFYCPNGHTETYGKSEAAREREKREEAEKRLTAEKGWSQRLSENLETERRSHAATKGKLTKAKNKAAAGQCLKCRRPFMNVARHYETQHGDA